MTKLSLLVVVQIGARSPCAERHEPRKLISRGSGARCAAGFYFTPTRNGCILSAASQPFVLMASLGNFLPRPIARARRLWKRPSPTQEPRCGLASVNDSFLRH